MIMMEPREWEEVLRMLEGIGEVAVVGCGKCAKANLVGGEGQVMVAKARLEKAGKKVTGTAVVGGLCNWPNSRGEIEGVKATDAILVLACGAGAQSVAALRRGVRVFPGADARFLGIFSEEGNHLRMCALCGDCIIHLTGGICPIARCPKGMANGPCGDSVDGTCGSVGMAGGPLECVWVKIAERGGKGAGRNRDWRKAGFPMDIVLPDDEVKRRKDG